MASASGWEFTVCDPGGLSTTSAERCSRVFMTTAARRMIGVTRKRFKDCGLLDVVRPRGEASARARNFRFQTAESSPSSSSRRFPRTRGGPARGFAAAGLGPQGTGPRDRQESQIRAATPAGVFVGTCDVCGIPRGPGGDSCRSPLAQSSGGTFQGRGTWALAPVGPAQPPRRLDSCSVSPDTLEVNVGRRWPRIQPLRRQEYVVSSLLVEGQEGKIHE